MSSEKEEHEESKKNDDYIRKEFSYHSFFRSFYLPDSVDESKIVANYKDGILHVTIYKKGGNKKKPPKRIEIK
ncbi:Hsp20/alpha crystallin family protein [Flavobacterium psychrotolerans]|uniref:Hsp20/alpha crystallin family protein n=1 Tax=Flavobacterium psychrotolerans TaxID=2169410 RepID=UPI001FB5FC3F|nr:Hsp20/alpha crystallin family protein [Flavobacterium psychrotolerans]